MKGSSRLLIPLLGMSLWNGEGSEEVNGATDAFCEEWAWDPQDSDPADEEYDWVELPPDKLAHYTAIGWTQQMWDTDEDPYFLQDWNEMKVRTQDAVNTLGWTEESWDSTDEKARSFQETKPWRQLTAAERTAATYLGYDMNSWPAHEWGSSFDPQLITFSIPELEELDLDYLATLDVEVELRDGDTVGDDELGERSKMKMKDYIQEVKKGSKLYLKYEDYDPFKTAIREQVGSKVLKYMGEKLRNSTLREQGYFKPEYDGVPLDDYNWLIWVGGTNSSTAMHYDDDTFNFIWVMQGRKRVVLLPNDDRTAGTYECKIEISGGDHSCWTGVDILSGHLPPHAIEMELGPGDGVMIPFLSWHAVKNLEPTVAYGYRIDLSEDVEDEDQD